MRGCLEVKVQLDDVARADAVGPLLIRESHHGFCLTAATALLWGIE
jgi:hypothetical protein